MNFLSDLFRKLFRNYIIKFHDLKAIWHVNRNLTDEQKEYLRLQMIEDRYKNFFLSFFFIGVAVLFLYVKTLLINPEKDPIVSIIWTIFCGLISLGGIWGIFYYTYLIFKHRKK